MPTPNDITVFRISQSWQELAAGNNALATATRAALPAHRHVITKVEASYSTASTSGLLRILAGAVVIAEKYIHGAGAMDFGDPGLIGPPSTEVSAELAASGSPGVFGRVTLFGFTLPGA